MDDIRKKVLVFEQSNTLARAYELAFLGSEWDLILVEDESMLLQIAAEEMPDVIVIEQSRISEETLSQLDEVGFALLCSGCRELKPPFLGTLPRPFSVTELFPVLQKTMEKSLEEASDEDEEIEVEETETAEEVASPDDAITEETLSTEGFSEDDGEHEIEILADGDDDDDDLLVVEEYDESDDTDDNVEVEVETEAEESIIEVEDDSDDEEVEIEIESNGDIEIEIENGSEDEEIEVEVESNGDIEIEIENGSEDNGIDVEVESDESEEIEVDSEECEDDDLMEFGSDDVLSLTTPQPAAEGSAPLAGNDREAISAIVQDELRTVIKELLWELAPDLIKQTVEEKITELYQQKNL